MATDRNHLAADLIARLREQRRKFVEVAPGKRVRLIRPPETQANRMYTPGPNDTLLIKASERDVLEFVDGWEGITEADLLGPELGSDALAPFTPALWAEVVGDRRDWAFAVGKALVDLVNAHELARDAAAKN
jgi:hypothetical protein